MVTFLVAYRNRAKTFYIANLDLARNLPYSILFYFNLMFKSQIISLFSILPNVLTANPKGYRGKGG